MRKHAIPATARPALKPSTAAFIATFVAQEGPPISQRSVADARRMLAGAQAGPVEKLPVEIEDRIIPGVDGGQLSIRIVRPPNGLATLPVVMYFHGGGWVLGDTHTHDRLIRELASGAHAAVVFVNYTPSPDAHYPVPIEEAYAATTWVADHGQTLKVDPTRLAVVGDGVGGNMAAAVTLLAKARGGPPIRFQLLFYPVTDADGKPIASFQMVQDLLAKMLANVTACQCMMVRLAQMDDAGKLLDQHASLAKAFCTARMRETVAWGRELFGGNGIVADYDAARFFADAEALYSYEGTYQMQNLIVGKAITGLSAFV